MAFRTKLDYSDNRQIRQTEKTHTILSGGTAFGMAFSALTHGPDPDFSGVSLTQINLVSTFSGNTGNTIYSWFDSTMNLGHSSLSALTSSNSGITQNTGIIFTASNTTIIDGNTVALAYTGVSFDISVIAMVDMGGGIVSGSVFTNTLENLSADTLDYTGRTIWVDVSGISRTQDLIITDTPVINYVWTCIDTEGRGVWAKGARSVSGTGVNSVVLGYNSTATGNTATGIGYQVNANGDYSNASGYQTNATGMASNASNSTTIASGAYSHAEGLGTTASGQASHTEGGDTTASLDWAHAEGFNTKALAWAAHSEGDTTTANNFTAHAEGNNTTARGSSSHASGFNTVASGDTSFAGGDSSIAGGLNSFIFSSASTVTGIRSVVLGGAHLTGTSNDYVYVPSLNINVVGSSAFANDIRIDAQGNLTTNTSDIRFKENINKITNALSKIKQLQGVTYQWKDRKAGGDEIKLGFIAQDVNLVEPNLVFTNKVDGYKGIHIDGIIPLLVEAVKELSSGIISNSYIETQTIFAEDNDIVLNYSGTQETAIGGGIHVSHALGIDLNAELKTDINGDWVTNNDFKSKSLTIPKYTPISSNDDFGNIGNITGDDNYLYFKTENGWKRSNLEKF